MSTFISSLLFMAVVSLGLGLLIALISRFFGVQADPRVSEVEEMLPAANCGGCGFAGCAAFAKAVVDGEAEPSQCPVNSADMSAKIAKFLGRELVFSEPHVALVKCCGDNVNSPERALYNGINDCNAAVLVAGATKACQYGCLGMASCSRACPFNAIEINEFNIAIVHPDLCVGCGKCLEVCPRDLISMVPKSAPVHVLCNSPERAPIQRAACKKGCIGCRKCVDASDGKIQMVGHLATIDYENFPEDPALSEVCPVNCIKPSVGLEYIPLEKPKAEKKKPAPLLPCHTALEITPQDDEATVKKAFAVKMGAAKKAQSAAAGDEAAEAKANEQINKLQIAYKAALALARKQQKETAGQES